MITTDNMVWHLAGCTADDPCPGQIFNNGVRYCQCPVAMPNCKNDECDTFCANTYDYNQSGDVTGTCRNAQTCLCRMRCV